MKNSFIVAMLLLSFFKSHAQEAALPISLHITLDKAYQRTFLKLIFAELIGEEGCTIADDSVKQEYYDVDLEIENTSNRRIGIWLMTCSWKNNFMINNNYISFAGKDCDSNFPEYVQFKPGERKMYKATLVKSIKFDYSCYYCCLYEQVRTTKLGLIIIDNIYGDSIGGSGYRTAMEDKSNWKIVWSNALMLLGRTAGGSAKDK